jgi:hypothetical protein
MKYLIFALTCCFLLKTFLIDKMGHAQSLEKSHSEKTYFTKNMHLDCHNLTKNLKPLANKDDDESSYPHDCNFTCLCTYFLNLQNTLMITSEEENNFLSSSNKKIYTDITNFTSLIINPPERPPICNS